MTACVPTTRVLAVPDHSDPAIERAELAAAITRERRACWRLVDLVALAPERGAYLLVLERIPGCLGSSPP